MDFWEKRASELFWYKNWEKECQLIDGHYQWFFGGQTNIAENICKNTSSKLALIWEGQDGTVKQFTYQDLSSQVNRFACFLKDEGIKKGDVVAIFLPKIPETLFLMLACAKIGAVHMVVFSGFGYQALKERLIDAQAKIIVTTKNYPYRQKTINSLETVSLAINGTSTKIALVENIPTKFNMVQSEVMKASDPLFILYTSGTTNKPKKIIHNHGGYMVGAYATAKEIFELDKTSIYFCTADFGWVTGHSYVTYGPLLNGATVVVYEGPPDYPNIDKWWELIEKYKITHFYTAPTAIRSLMKFGTAPLKKHNLTSLKVLGSVGEPLDKQSGLWFKKHVGGNKCPLKDTWWQTETGMILLIGKPFKDILMDIENGELVIKTPWPSMWQNITLPYHVGDLAKKLKNGNFQILGRKDDVLNVAGHRLSSAEIEAAVNSSPHVCESAAIGLPDSLKGEKIKVYAILNAGVTGSDKIKQEVVDHVRLHLGPVATPSEIEIVDKLPKTRSGKIMRRLLRAQSLNLPLGDTSTLEN